MSEQQHKVIQELQREIQRLQLALKQEKEQLKQFDEGLTDVNTAVMSLVDKNFDGNVYRNALEHSFKEHVYTKIRNLFGTIAIIAGVGGFFFVNATIERLVEKTIQEQQGDFVRASANLKRERLIFLLRELNEKGAERAVDIQKEEDFLPYLKEFILAEEEPVKQRLAIDYASLTRDRDLLEPLFRILEEGDSPEMRIHALRALLEFLPNPKVAKILLEVMKLESNEIDESPLWLEFTRVMSFKTYHSPDTQQMVDSAMQQALRSLRPEVFRGAVLFYLLNNDLWNKDYATSIRAVRKDEYVKLLQSPGDEGNEDFLDREMKVADPKKDNAADSRKDNYAIKQLRLIQGYVALAQLKKGQQKLMITVFENYLDEDAVFPDSVWDEIIGRYFPDFTQGGQPGEIDSGSEQLLPTAGEPDWREVRLAQRLPHYRWIEAGRVYSYQDPQVPSIERLAIGNTDGVRDYLATSYYDPENWRSVLKYFPEFVAEFRDVGLHEDVYWQDELYNLLEFFLWDPTEKVYKYEDLEEYDSQEDLYLEEYDSQEGL